MSIAYVRRYIVLQATYGEEMTAQVDPVALYHSSGGIKHGRFAKHFDYVVYVLMFNSHSNLSTVEGLWVMVLYSLIVKEAHLL